MNTNMNSKDEGTALFAADDLLQKQESSRAHNGTYRALTRKQAIPKGKSGRDIGRIYR